MHYSLLQLPLSQEKGPYASGTTACTTCNANWTEIEEALRSEPGQKPSVVGFWGYPQPGGGTHPPIPRGEVLGEVQSD